MVELRKQNYNKNKQLYKKIEKQLRIYLNENIPIDHVGSTAIKNMYGKNIIDILIGAKDNLEFENIKMVLENMNFIPSKRSEDLIYQFFASTKEETSSGDIHIHLVMKDKERYLEFLILKEYLINNPNEVKNYSNFKRELLDNGIIDRKEYKRIKSEYVSSLIERAKNNKK